MLDRQTLKQDWFYTNTPLKPNKIILMDVYRCNLNEKRCLSSTCVFDHVFVHETVRDSGQLDLKFKCGLFDLVFVVVRYVYIN